jgi:hypothetical protein
MTTPRTSFAVLCGCLLFAFLAVAAVPVAAQEQCDFVCSGAPCTTSCWYCLGDFQDFCPFNHVVYSTCGQFAGGCTSALTPAPPIPSAALGQKLIVSFEPVTSPPRAVKLRRSS